MKKLLFLILWCAVAGACFGQKYYVGAAIGWHQDIFTMSETNKKISNDRIYLYNPSANLNFGFLFKNNVALSLGVGYYKYKFERFIDPLVKEIKRDGMIASIDMYEALSIPVSVGYNINLWKNRLFFKIQNGLDFDIYFPALDGGGGYYGKIALEVLNRASIETRFNILLSNKISLQYYTKSNMNIAIFGAYHAGLRQVWKDAVGHFEWKSEDDPEEWQIDERGNIVWNQGSEIFDTKFNSNGSYWQFGIELGYRFGGKKKESTH
jgi:hypothetical protein